MEWINNIINNFTFIRPEWLLAALPVLIIYLLKLKFGQHQNLWQQVIPSHLYQKLLISKGMGKPSRYIHSAFLAWIISVVAIAGPSWEKLPQAVYQTQAGKVLLLDMSMSMRATDLSPNRLTRARFKAIDLINQLSEGETGLVAYAGDAFVISPLTDDADTLTNLIPSLRPEIMPTGGSYALSGLERAASLLAGAGYNSGDIYWISDGIRIDEVDEVRSFIQNSAFNVSALLVGTEEGAPITLSDGKLLKDYSGAIVVPSVNARYFEQAMSGTSATYSLFASDNSDIAKIKRKIDFEQQQQAKQVEDTTGDTYKDMGPYLVLLLLPVAAYGFRRGIMMCLLVGITGMGLLSPTHVYANDDTQNSTSLANTPSADTSSFGSQKITQLTQQVFKNANQRGKLAFDKADYGRASELFENKEWQAASAYKKGDYATAASLYNELDGVENTYNKANALAKAMQLKGAIEAYNQVLLDDPEHENALKNKQIVEQMLEQQEQDQQQQSDSDQSQQNQDKSEQNQESQDQESQTGEQQESEQAQGNEQDNTGENSGNEQSQKNDDRQLDDQSESQQYNQQNEPSQQADEPSDGEHQTLPTNEVKDPLEQQEAISSNEFAMENLSPEEQEEMQRLQMILNKVPDDPAYLLQRKMLLESHRRKNRPVPPTQENW